MMNKEQKQTIQGRRIALLLPVLLIFCILGGVVYTVSAKIQREMSASAVSNLTESLDLIKGTIEAVLGKEAEFQKMIARELSVIDDPDTFIRTYNRNRTMVRLSLVPEGETEGVSNVGEVFSARELDFSAGKTVADLPVSQSYVNSMGTWAYTIQCPVEKDGREIATFYAEYAYTSFEEALPGRFYNNNALLYIMDTSSQRLVLNPRGIGERDAGHVNLEDFYRANRIMAPEIQEEVARNIREGKNVLFYHDIRNKDSLIFMWAVNDGSLYLIGHVPVEAVQQEGRTVNQNILLVVAVMLLAFGFCCVLYFGNERQQGRIRREREREREIHSRQLAEALQAAQVANTSKTMFLSNMSHDIRTPMNAILGFTTLLARDADNPVKVREYTKKITASGQHLLSLINDVLDVSKIESGKVVLTIGEFSLSSMIASVDAIIRPMARARGQSFEVTVTGVKHEELVGDETRLNQILINLLSNSVKYTQEGGRIWLRIIGLEQRSRQYEHIRIEVEDNGYGMTPEYLKVIFDAFTRAENSTTNKVQGTGLGMAITKNIVELMGGTITVTSQVGEGSLFRVELELRTADGKAREQFWKDHGVSRILAVDDDQDILESIRMLMENTGVRVDTCTGGEEAADMVRTAISAEDGYDAVLLDLEMPKTGGIETARQIRPMLPEHVPILILTACDWDGLEDTASHVGINGFLSKPFFVSAFKEKILEVQAEAGREEPAGEAGDGSLEGCRFLVAEDNEINAEILSELLDLEGASCEILENGKLVLDRFAQGQPGEFDAILMDVQMPVMNGYEASRAIRSLDREDAGTIPIIAMTANAFAEDVKDAMDAGMNAHVSKPIDMALLKQTVRKYL